MSFLGDRIPGDDRVLSVTRALAVFIVPFLIAAFVLLYFLPERTDDTFAWAIRPTMTPMMLGAAYLGGIYFFARVALNAKWHEIKAGFLPVTTFASLLGLATILHWDKFNHGHVSFWAWAGLYFTTPVLVIADWLWNRGANNGEAGRNEFILSRRIRGMMAFFGAVTVAVSAFLFIAPNTAIDQWPWALTPLTARVLSAMFALPGVVGISLALDRRWSSSRVMLEAQVLSIVAILIAAVRARSEIDKGSIEGILFLGGLTGFAIALVTVYVAIEMKARRASSRVA